MKREVYVEVIPFDKDMVLFALEAGVQGVIVDDAHMSEVEGLARCEFVPSSQIERILFEHKEDEINYANALRIGKTKQAGQDKQALGARQKQTGQKQTGQKQTGQTQTGQTQIEKTEKTLSEKKLVLGKGWEIIPVENLLAQPDIAEKVCLEVRSLEEAKLALGILERGVNSLLVAGDAMPKLRDIMALCATDTDKIVLEKASVTSVRPVGLGHRVCVDTMSVLQMGQGMLTGNSSAFTFLVHAETEENNYVNSRPFRINAGAVHAYAMMPEDKTRYLEELAPGDEVLIVSADGTCESAVIGRVKVEVRPMLFIEAITSSGKKGGVFLQNAETIRVVSAEGKPISVVTLKEGDEILCHTDNAGRHFGMRIEENISE